jgi:hypothetical protein
VNNERNWNIQNDVENNGLTTGKILSLDTASASIQWSSPAWADEIREQLVDVAAILLAKGAQKDARATVLDTIQLQLFFMG